MKVAVVGATGLVGSKILEIMCERKYPLSELIPVASKRSLGKTITYNDKKYSVISIEEAIEQKPAIAIFSAGGNTSLQFAPEFANNGTKVIDNSSAWRMDKTKKLIIPEVNANVLTKDDYIIANPNCSTIQMVLVLKPLHDHYKIKRVVVSTYQSVTGSGIKAVNQLKAERNQEEVEMAYPHKIDMNIIPHIDTFLEEGYTKEELKMINETKKIMDDDSISITATAVRIPVTGGHSESINIEFYKNYDLNEIRELLIKQEGVSVEDDPKNNIYPMPINSHNRDEVFVGRIRRDYSQENALNLWVVADNLRKGAATNAVQIAEYIVNKQLL